MTTISILPEPLGGQTSYRAFAGALQSVGRTPGEALDILAGQLAAHESGTLIVVQHMRADEFLSADERQRLEELMHRWRIARANGSTLPDEEQAKLDELVAAELVAATRRAESVIDETQR